MVNSKLEQGRIGPYRTGKANTFCRGPVARIRKLQMQVANARNPGKVAKVCKLQREDELMEPNETAMTDGGDAEEEYILQLRALLHDLG